MLASTLRSREIVALRSHDFDRNLTSFKAEWDPKDSREGRFVVGRYISEEYNGLARHPIDVMDASTGRLLRELVDSNLETITPVNKMHPMRDVIISGSSRSLYMWCPVPEPDAPDARATATAGAEFGFGSSGPRRATGSSRFVSFDAAPGEGSGSRKGKGAAAGKKEGGGTKRKPPAAKGGSSVRKPEFDLSDDDDCM
ncbi:hypothetical protein FOA52_004071 [Chlamydomonas sp. UWO 241]|nr:hypothetical protein FOA52_004071 [Chlamydomonas sp. UWO 241]